VSLGGKFTLEEGYDLTAQTATAHTEVKYWLVSSCLENYAQGAARAAESLGRDSDFLISDVGSVMLPMEWDSGYNGAWKTCYAISDYAYAAPAAMGLIALADGRATPETLWADRRAEGDKASIWIAESSMVTKDTYKDYFVSVDKKYGVEK
jgi:ABC-type sugar transport system substrate-binding protein